MYARGAFVYNKKNSSKLFVTWNVFDNYVIFFSFTENFICPYNIEESFACFFSFIFSVQKGRRRRNFLSFWYFFPAFHENQKNFLIQFTRLCKFSFFLNIKLRIGCDISTLIKFFWHIPFIYLWMSLDSMYKTWIFVNSMMKFANMFH